MTIAFLAGCLALSAAALPDAAKATGEPAGYWARPESGSGRGVLVLHPWWGLNADVRAICDRLAASGFVAFAPDLFDGKTATTPTEAKALAKAHDAKEPELKAIIGKAAESLADRTGGKQIAVLGLSFGAYYALDFSNDEPTRVRAVVVFYGTGPEEFGKSKAAYLGHFAAEDDFEPKASVDALEGFLRAAGRPVTFHTYPGTGHWFFEPGVKSAYNPAATEKAWERTLAFLKIELA